LQIPILNTFEFHPIIHILQRLARIGAAVSSLDSLLDSIGNGAHGFGAIDNLLFHLDEDGLGEGESRPLRQARLLEQEFQLLQERNNDSLAKLREMGQGLGQIRAKVQAENRRVVGWFWWEKNIFK
jgi:hypothetical protein